MRAAPLLCVVLVACGSSSGAASPGPQDSGTADTAMGPADAAEGGGDGGAGAPDAHRDSGGDAEAGPVYPAAHPPLPQVVNSGGPVMKSPKFVVITFAGDKSGKYTEAPATGALAERAKQLHNQLIEYIAESDDALMEKFENLCHTLA